MTHTQEQPLSIPVAVEAIATPGVQPPSAEAVQLSVPAPAATLPLPCAPSRAPAVGASALIADAERLLPAGTPAAPAPEAASARPGRASAGFQPAGRFSRSQQAFLRVPITITGRNATGAEFGEDTSTVILLPQGAVIHMEQRVRAGDALALFNPARQQEVPCSVVGALPGPDGKMLVEIEFSNQQRNFWPVSFPAWSRNAAGNRPARRSSPARVPALTNLSS